MPISTRACSLVNSLRFATAKLQYRDTAVWAAAGSSLPRPSSTATLLTPAWNSSMASINLTGSCRCVTWPVRGGP